MNKVTLLGMAALLPGLIFGVGTASASDVSMATVEIDADGEVRIDEGIVKSADADMAKLSVKADTAKFTVKILPGAELRVNGEDVLTLSGVMKGDLAQVRGTLDPTMAHTILADRVRIETPEADLNSDSGSQSGSDSKVEIKADLADVKLDAKLEIEEVEVEDAEADDNSGPGSMN